MNKLFHLLARNRGQGTSRIEATADEATVWIYDVIVDSDATAEWWGGVSAESLVKQLRTIDATTINVRINSPGGDVFAARAIEQALREHSARIVVHVDGYAASAASLIAVAADHVIMAQGSFMMIHKAWTIAIGNADDLMATAGLLEKIDSTIEASYTAKAGAKGKGQDFAVLMAAETWFTADEAVAIGLADEVAASAVKASAQPKWDMTAYDHAPAPPAEPPVADTAPSNKIDHRTRALRLIAAPA